jgi:hypothetical protein
MIEVRVRGSEFRIRSSAFEGRGLGFWDCGSGSRNCSSGSRVQGVGLGVDLRTRACVDVGPFSRSGGALDCPCCARNAVTRDASACEGLGVWAQGLGVRVYKLGFRV